MKMSHMIADSDDELHAMAARIGLARRHYQGDHYDVSMSLRRKAIECGAVAITLRELAHMARGKKPGTKATNKAVAGLLQALKFIEPASADTGQVNQTHCAFGGHWVAQFNGLIMLAAKVDTDIVAYPNTKRLIAVLSKCDEATQITQLDNNRLGIKAGRFSAVVPCVEPGLIALTPPDPPQYDLSPAVLASLGIVAVNAKENAPRMVQASVLLRANSAVSTDGAVLMEHWHGTNLPTVVLPKVFVSTLLNIGKTPTKLGASQTTCTVYFEDDSFIRTQLYTEPYANVDRVLNVRGAPLPLPGEFWPAVEKLRSMADPEHRDIFFNAAGKKLQTHTFDNVGASFEYEHPLPDGVRLNIELLARFAPHAKQADFAAGDRKDMAVFYGDNFRGMLMHKFNDNKPHAQPSMPREDGPTIAATGGMPPHGHGNMDDEIPF